MFEENAEKSVPKIENGLLQEENFGQPLTREGVDSIITSFFDHIAKNWDTYKNNLPSLGRTMMFYNEFAYGIRLLPENESYDIEFNPRDPLLDGDLERAFGDNYTEEIGKLVYDAWPLRQEFEPWAGYEEPIEDTPEALMKAYPTLYTTIEQAREGFADTLGTGRAMYQGRIVHVKPRGTPEILFKGFTTIEEFPAQKEFLDTIRNNPRIRYGIFLLEKVYEKARLKREQEAERWDKLNETINKISILKTNPTSDEDLAALHNQLNEFLAEQSADT
jgi:hypothetical protein